MCCAAPVIFVIALAATLAAPAGALYFRKDHIEDLAPGVADILIKENPHFGNRFDGVLLGSRHVDEAPWAGQEMRFIVRTSMVNSTVFKRLAFSHEHDEAFSHFPGWNASGPSNVRVRVIAAFEERMGGPGEAIPCWHGPRHDVWSETWAVSPQVFGFGGHIVFSGYFTFVAPPFPFRVCVKSVNPHNASSPNRDRGPNAGWMEFRNYQRQFGRRVFTPREPLFLFAAGATNFVGDFAAITVFAHTNVTSFSDVPFDAARFSTHDSVKLVPAGFPCTHEKPNSHASRMQTLTPTPERRQYCGSNMVLPDGRWRPGSSCVAEGAVEEGIAHVGSSRQNPLAPLPGHAPDDFVASGDFPRGARLAGYLRLQHAGAFDVCVSTRSYRIVAFNTSLSATAEGTYPRDARPVWFKAYNANSSDCADVLDHTSSSMDDACTPRRTQLEVSKTVSDITWHLQDRAPGAWAELRFTATANGELNFNAAAAWEHSSPREYARLRGGDQFRLVRAERFPAASVAPRVALGNLFSDAAGRRFTVRVVEREGYDSSAHVVTERNVVEVDMPTASLDTPDAASFTQLRNGDPGLGTQLPTEYPGCFFSGDDNYGAAGLNGAPGDKCCTPDSSGSSECRAMGFCALSDSGGAGPTASGDLGGNPRESTGGAADEQQPWTLDGTGPSSWGYIRVPLSGRWFVCYRRAGGNWRVAVPGFSAPNATFLPRRLHSGYTGHINDTSALTQGPVEIASPRWDLTMRDWNYFSNPQAAPVGAVLKMVRDVENCQTASAYPLTWSASPGALECPATPLPSGACLGPLDIDLRPHDRIFFHIRMPPYVMTHRFRVCFRRADESWQQLEFPRFRVHALMDSPSLFHPTPEPHLEFQLEDRSSGTWGKLVVRHRRGFQGSLQALDSRPGGDVLRIMPNVSASGGDHVPCFLTWGSSQLTMLGAAQRLMEYSNETVVTDLGTYCDPASASTWCAESTRTPTIGGISAAFPYTTVVPGGDHHPIHEDDGTVAFMQLPSQRPAAYKVCYKPRGRNWIEAREAGTGRRYFALQQPPTVRITASSEHLLSGSYAFFELTSSVHPIRWSTDAAKLVPQGETCEAPAAGSLGFGNRFVSIAGVSLTQHGRGIIVDGTNETTVRYSGGADGETMVARVYLPLPTVESFEERMDEYRLCYMRRSTGPGGTPNWLDVTGADPVRVRHLGIQFTILEPPMRFRLVTVTFLAGSWVFNTMPDTGDRAKLIAPELSCGDSTHDTQPESAYSEHLGLEGDGDHNGVRNLGPSDELASLTATMRTVLPAAPYLKVCFKPAGLPWMQVEQVGVSRQVHSLPETGLTTIPSDILGCTFANTLFAQTPTASVPDYAPGVPFSTVLLGGAATRAVDGSNLFHVTRATPAATPVTDQFRFVQISREIAIGIYEPTGDRSCEDGSGSVEVSSGTSVEVRVDTHLPVVAGRYLFCYKVGGSDVWLQPATMGAGSNPLTIVSNKMDFDVDNDASMNVRDLFVLRGMNGGGLVGSDRVYVTVSATVPCGLAETHDGQPGASSAVALSNSQFSGGSMDPVPQRWVIAANLLPTSTGIFSVCLLRSQQGVTTHGTGLLPFVRGGWYRIPNGGRRYGPGSDFIVRTQVSQLAVGGCPASTAATPLRTGTVMDLTVSLMDANGAHIPLDGVEVAVQTNGLEVGSNRATCTAGNAPLFNATHLYLAERTIRGRARFMLSPLSLCPALPGTCSVSFVAVGMAATAPTCTFHVAPTQIASLRPVAPPERCEIDEDCVVRVAAFDTDDQLAYASRDAITLVVQRISGLTVAAMSDGVHLPVGVSSSTRFKAGYVTITMRFSSQSFTDIADVTHALVSVEANALRSPPATIELHKPRLSAVHIIDVTAVDVAHVVAHPLTPSWQPNVADEPRIFRGGFADVLNGAANLDAGPGAHLVAGQFYAVTLRAVQSTPNTVPHYIRSNRLMDPRTRITMSIDNVSAAENRLLSANGCLSLHECARTFTFSEFSHPTDRVIFRVRSAAGCRRASGGCTLRFRFGGIDVGEGTSLTTPVRGLATTLRLVAGELVSTVSKGWNLTVHAEDADGLRDEFLEGDVHVALRGAPADVELVALPRREPPDDRLVTTDDGATLLRAAMREGVAELRFSLTRPCHSCEIHIVGEGVAHVLRLELSAPPDTHELQCALETPLMQCTMAGNDCATLEGKEPSESTVALLYSGTNFCVSATGVDSSGAVTEYERSWVSFHAVSLGDTPVVVMDGGASAELHKRYRPMQFSRARFCMSVATVAASETPVEFELHFTAQRFTDPGHWASQRGRCVLRRLVLFPRKIAAGLSIADVSGPASLTALPSAPTHFAGEYTGSPQQAIFSFVLLDHYGDRIAASDLQAGQSAFVLDAVRNPNGVAVVSAGSIALRGMLSVSAETTPPSIGLTEPLTFAVAIDKYCLGCSITFLLRDGTTPVALRTVMSPTIAKEIVVVAGLHIVNRAPSATKRLSFAPWGNPFHHWTSGVQLSRSPPVLHDPSCWSSTCRPQHSSLLHSRCDDSDAADVLTASGGQPMAVVPLIVDSGAALSSTFESTATSPATVATQVDIMTSFTISPAIGAQRLACVAPGSACSASGTMRPAQVIPALGPTLIAAVTAVLGRTDEELPNALLALEGIDCSTFMDVDSDGALQSLPSLRGPLTIAATAVPAAEVTPITSPGAIAWRGPRRAAFLLVRDSTRDTDNASPEQLPCHHAYMGSACSPRDGWPRRAPLSTIAFAYAAQPLLVGVPFPVTVDIADLTAERTFGANGTLSVTHFSVGGCNDGGALDATSTDVVNGRANVWITFTKPCQACILHFQVQPDTSQATTVFTQMMSNLGGLEARSNPITVVTATHPEPSHVVITHADGLRASLRISDVVALQLQSRGNVGALSLDSWRQPSAVSAYNTVQTASKNWWWYGNGGILRPSLDASPSRRHMAAARFAGSHGQGTLTFAFTRTCTSCRVTVLYATPGGEQGFFTLEPRPGNPDISVRTLVPTHQFLTLPPSRAIKGCPIAVTRVQAGSELAAHPTHPIPSAGVVDFDVLTAADTGAILVTAIDDANGGGGMMQRSRIVGDRRETLLLTLSDACNECEVAVNGTPPFTMAVTAVATHLRVQFPPFAPTHFNMTVGDVQQFVVDAVDDDGIVDVLFGDTSCKFGASPFHCGTAADAIGVSAMLFARVFENGTLSAHFEPQNTNMLSTGTTTGAVTGPGFVNGRAIAGVTIAHSVRYAVLTFAAAGPHAAVATAVKPFVALPSVTVSSPTWSVVLTCHTAHSAVSGALAVPMLPLAIDVAAIVSLPGTMLSSNPSTQEPYIAGHANNTVSLHLVDCPPIAGHNGIVDAHELKWRLLRGLAHVHVTFATSSPDPTKQCTLTFHMSADGAASCSSPLDCEDVVAVHVRDVLATRFSILGPTAIDNGGAEPGLMYGISGRKTVLELQLRTDDFDRAVCPGCSLEVTKVADASEPFASCNFAIAFPGNDRGAFDAAGRVTAVFSWGSSSAMYRCKISVAVATGNASYTVRGPNGDAELVFNVEVRRPSQLMLLTNVTSDLPRTLETGRPYPFHVVIVDAAGVVCRGDTHEGATLLLLDVLTAAHTPTDRIRALNTNLTTSEAHAQYPPSLANEVPPLSSARSVSGGFVFHVIFTNSTVNLGYIGGVRLRIRAADGTLSPVVSHPFRIVVAAAALAFAANAALPIHVVRLHPIITCCNASTTVAIEAVDALGFYGLQPNVASRDGEMGSNVHVSLSAVPAHRSGFPLHFYGGPSTVRRVPLTFGRVAWSGMKWVAPEGAYTLVARVEEHPEIQMSALVVAQTTMQLGLGGCVADCALPTFDPLVNHSLQLEPFMVSSSLRSITVDVRLVDARGELVVGDSESFVAMELERDDRTPLRVMVPPTFDWEHSMIARARAGVATFTFGFSGSTQNIEDSAETLLAALTFRCPAERPRDALHPDEEERLANPCAGAGAVSTRRLQVHDARPPRRLFGEPVVLLWKETLRFRLLPSIAFVSDVSVWQLRAHLAQWLDATGRFPYISAENIDAIVSVQLCAVTPLFAPDNDLPRDVCTGPHAECAGVHPVGCPAQVLVCACDLPGLVAGGQDSHSHLLRRYLLQSKEENSTLENETHVPSTPVPLPNLNGTIAVELFFSLENAAGLVAPRAFDIAMQYRDLQEASRQFLQNEATVQTFHIDVSSLSSRPWNQELLLATHEPTAAPDEAVANASEVPTDGREGGADAAAAPVLGTPLLALAATLLFVFVPT